VSYINIAGRLLLVQRAGWLQPLHRALDLRESMRERYRDYSPSRQGEAPEARADHLGQWPAIHRRDFKEFIRISGMTHVRTSPYYPQSNGKIERWHNRSRRMYSAGTPLTPEDARRLIQQYVDHYNTCGYTAPSAL